jgi:hypothetical protein
MIGPNVTGKFECPVVDSLIRDLANDTESELDCKQSDGVTSPGLRLIWPGTDDFIEKSSAKEGFLPAVCFLVRIDEVRARLIYDPLPIGAPGRLILIPPCNRLTSLERCVFMRKRNCLGMVLSSADLCNAGTKRQLRRTYLATVSARSICRWSLCGSQQTGRERW